MRNADKTLTATSPAIRYEANGIIPKLRWNAMHCEWHVAIVLPCGNETNIVDSAIWLARVEVSELYSVCTTENQYGGQNESKSKYKMAMQNLHFFDSILRPNYEIENFHFFMHTYHWTGWGCIDLDFFNNYNFQIYMNWVYFGKHVNYDILLKK